MISNRTIVRFILLAALAGPAIPVNATPQKPETATAARDGAHDFDFEFGRWRVHHRIKRPDNTWTIFEGTCTAHPVLGGNGNVEDNIFVKAGGATRGVALRAYDPKSATWAIWWVDGRNPHGALDPPVKGRFENGVGTFYSDGVINGKAASTRFTWSRITRTSARWEQAYSFDNRVTWETNWVMDFKRVP